MEAVKNEVVGTPEYKYDFSGGLVCLDFTNTVGGRTGLRPGEHMKDYAALAAWGRQARLLSEADTRQLLEQAHQDPGAAEAVYRRGLALREAIYALVSAHTRGQPHPGAALEILNCELRLAHQHLELLPEGDGYDWCWNNLPVALDSILWLVARSAGDLLTSADLERTGMCQGDGCGWLFLDTSKNHSRRWCAMNDCGNRAKARHFYQRKKVSGK